jgi:5-(carboxyamino)imidazole ribonucleotide mutase
MKTQTKKQRNKKPWVGIILGSKSDWETMREAANVLDQFQIPYEARVVSAHRTPRLLASYASTAEKRGLKVIIAGAGGSAHLPGMAAAYTIVPVIGVPVRTKALDGLDSFLSIIQMPAGIPVACTLIGPLGATHAAQLALRILASVRPDLKAYLELQLAHSSKRKP